MQKIAMIFPGQGSQYVGMGKDLYKHYQVAKDVFDQADEVLGYRLTDICFSGRTIELNTLENMLLSIFVTSIALFKVYMEEIGITPRFMAGHSLGEYSALTCSSVIRFEDAINIIRKRSQLAGQVSGLMSIADNVDPRKVKEICSEITEKTGKTVDIACYNSFDQVAICGEEEEVLLAGEMLLTEGAQVTPIFNGAPFHCKVMEPIRPFLKEELEKYEYRQPLYPVISNVKASPYNQVAEIIPNLVDQVVSPVQWQQTINFFKNENISILIEMGPQGILSNLLKRDEKTFKCFSFSQKDDCQCLRKLLSINGNIYIPSVVDKCLAIAAGTPNYNENNPEYQKGVIEPYQNLWKINDSVENRDSLMTDDEIILCLKAIVQILKTKKISAMEQREIYRILLSETQIPDCFERYLVVND
jgi:[acyl-carrier-protein] S-malonyltransferase